MTDYTTKEPSYAFILRTIREKIDRGELNPGDRLPTEDELRVQFGGVSRGTVRKAMDELETHGYIIRRSGMGTFVARRMMKETGEIVSFSTQIERIGLDSKTVVISTGLVQARLVIGRAIEAFPDLENAEVLVIHRLKSGNGEPYAIQTVYLDPRRVPGLLDLPVKSLERLFQLYKEQYNIVIREVDEQLRAESVSVGEAELLQIEPGSPVVVRDRISLDQTGKPFEVLHSVDRGDKFVYHHRSRTDWVIKAVKN